MAAPIITAARLRELVSYDPETGHFTARVTWPKTPAGKRLGTIGPLGYVQMGLAYGKYYAHRLAFLYVTGEWPAGTVDHVDGERANNRWNNLRDVPHGVNVENVLRARKHSSSGLLGASWSTRRGHWTATVRVKGRNIYIGSFDSAEAAHTAYLEAKRRLHKGCTI
jgi:hypothetical protein